MIEFKNVSFTYPAEESSEDQAEAQSVFNNINLTLPKGVISLLGPNGSGKSTLLLLAGGCIPPETGTVTVDGIDTKELGDEAQRQKLISFIFQNMEFETEENIGDLLRLVYETGFWPEKDPAFITELIDVFELQNTLTKKTQEVSKGQLQRAILAFSLLYGSAYLMMDEPIFALEDYQKIRALDYLTRFTREHQLSLLYSIHELELSQKYSDYLLLFAKDQTPLFGPSAEIFNPTLIEQAYQIPFSMLKSKELIYREALNRGLL